MSKKSDGTVRIKVEPTKEQIEDIEKINQLRGGTCKSFIKEAVHNFLATEAQSLSARVLKILCSRKPLLLSDDEAKELAKALPPAAPEEAKQRKSHLFYSGRLWKMLFAIGVGCSLFLGTGLFIDQDGDGFPDWFEFITHTFDSQAYDA